MTTQYKYGDRAATVEDAAGVSGVLYRSIDNNFFFRVYHEDGEFTDYDLMVR